MQHYRNLIKKHRIISISLSIISLFFILLSILLFTGVKENDSFITPLILIIISGVVFVFSISYMMLSLCLKIKVYNHNGNKIEIYTGYKRYCLFVNDELKQEYKGRPTIKNIYLNTNYEGYEINVCINMNNKIVVRVNNEIINVQK